MSHSVIDRDSKVDADLSPEELARYARHFGLPEMTLGAQKQLKAARVLCIGAGGLGSPATLYLAAAGIGTIGLLDADAVECSNLQRQILHGTKDIGRKKIDSARDRLRDANPNVNLELHNCEFNTLNAKELVARYDIVIDGSDNLPTRYLSNDVCVSGHKPNIYGAVFRFEGQSTVFAPHLGGPCYRCLFPEPPPANSIPTCAEAGVLGVVPGIIGLIQATECIKLVIGRGQSLIGRMLQFDALKMQVREFNLPRDPQCPACGQNPTTTFNPSDYQRSSCGTGLNVPTISVIELKRQMETKAPLKIVDVREPFEFDIARIEGAELIPLGQLPARLTHLSENDDIVVMCKSGARSANAVEVMQQAGLKGARNLEGGIDAWREQVDPSLPRY